MTNGSAVAGKESDYTKLFFAGIGVAFVAVFILFAVIAFVPGLFCCTYDLQLEQIAASAVMKKIPSNVLESKVETGFIEWARNNAWVQVTVKGTNENGSPFLKFYEVKINRKTGVIIEIQEVS